MPRCVIFEDEHLLVVNKPAGWNTHAPSPYAGEGIYDWLKHREPRWAHLAIVHRLDKETSGVMVFGKTPLANRLLTEQFTSRGVRKKYLLLTDRAPKQREFTAMSKIARAGERYISGTHGELAETRFQIRNPKSEIRSRSRLLTSAATGPAARVAGLLLLATVLWLPLRAGLLAGAFLHRALRTEFEEPLNLMNQFWSPWLQCLLLLPLALLTARWLRHIPCAQRSPSFLQPPQSRSSFEPLHWASPLPPC